MTDDQNTDAVIGPGAQLRQAREAKGLDANAVADELRILRSQFRAMEQDDYHLFTADVFAKGYLRAYANFLQLDAEPLLALYDQHYRRDEEQLQPITTANISAQQPAAKRYWGWAIFALLLILLWWYKGQQQTPPAATSVGALTVAEPVLDVSTVAVPAIETTEAIDASLAPSADDLLALAETATLAPVEEALVAEPALLSTAETLADTEPAWAATKITAPEIASAPVFDGLRLAFSGDCWVKVVDAEGTVLASGLKRAADIVEVSGIPPLKVVLGDASVVSVSYNNEFVNVQPSARNQSARFTVGS
jgi:cytoskeleton protein RodZ